MKIAKTILVNDLLEGLVNGTMTEDEVKRILSHDDRLAWGVMQFDPRAAGGKWDSKPYVEAYWKLQSLAREGNKRYERELDRKTNQSVYTPSSRNQLWEPCEKCGKEPSYATSRGHLCKNCIGQTANCNGITKRLAKIASSLSWKILAEDARWEHPTSERKQWRRKLPDGSYEYRDAPPDEEGSKQQVPQQQKETPKKEEPAKTEKKVYKHHVVLDKKALEDTLSHGYFSIVSAGRNPNDPKEEKMKPDDEFFHKRHDELKNELEKLGLNYTDAVGHYRGKEPSYIVFHDQQELSAKNIKSVIVHHKDKESSKETTKKIEEIGKKFNQDSVLHGSAGTNKIIFTTGKQAGKSCGGKGWKETPEAKDYYTDVVLNKGNHTKFNLDIQECFDKKMLSTTPT